MAKRDLDGQIRRAHPLAAFRSTVRAGYLVWDG